MQTPTNINNQQVWGGQSYPLGSSADTVGPQTQHTLLPRERQEPHFRSSSQAGFIASDSDDLFHPAPGGPSSRVFHLPDVPYLPILVFAHIVSLPTRCIVVLYLILLPLLLITTLRLRFPLPYHVLHTILLPLFLKMLEVIWNHHLQLILTPILSLFVILLDLFILLSRSLL